MAENRQTAVPRGRLNRLLRLGRLAGGLATGAMTRGAAQLARGQSPDIAAVLLHPSSAQRITEELAQMRGAVMKIGQLLSMEAGDLLPPELTGILAELRNSAHAMPRAELRQVLDNAWGQDWLRDFESFEMEPFAAASIGQVHAAVDGDGRRLAIKVQYPGVADSIDSDIDNVGRILSLLRLLPPGFDLESMLEIARRQLHEEADYRLEAQNLNRYRHCLDGHPVFRLPEVVVQRSDLRVLTMSFVDGDAIENLAVAPAALRNRVAADMIELTLNEFLRWGLVQSDANFANFVHDAASETIGLFDFGALRIYAPHRLDAFAHLLEAALRDDLAAIVDAAIEVGYLEAADPFNFRLAIVDLVRIAVEPARHGGDYDFANSRLAQRLGERLYDLRRHAQSHRIPPQDVIFLHRKLAGIFLLCARINARVDVRGLIDAVLTARRGPAASTPAA